MRKKNHSFTSYTAAKHQKHCKWKVTDIQEKPVDFLCGIALASNLVPSIICKLGSIA